MANYCGLATTTISHTHFQKVIL